MLVEMDYFDKIAGTLRIFVHFDRAGLLFPEVVKQSRNPDNQIVSRSAVASVKIVVKHIELVVSADVFLGAAPASGEFRKKNPEDSGLLHKMKRS